MEKLNSFIHGSVICNIKSKDKFMAIHEIINTASVFQQTGKTSEIERAVVQREKMQSTDLGHGIAVTHGKCPSVSEVAVALGISKKGIIFSNTQQEPVHFIFVVTNPPEAWDDYLRTLSSIIKLIKDPRVQAMLLKQKNPNNIECELHRQILPLLGQN